MGIAGRLNKAVVPLTVLVMPIAGLLVACSQPDSSTPTAAITETVTETQTPPSRGAITDEDRVFLSELQSSSEWDGYFSTVPREKLIAAAERVCGEMRAGNKAELLETGMGSGMNLSRSALLMGASAKAYCPDQLTGIQ